MQYCPVIVGREGELSRLGSMLEQGGVVLVTGEAGIGKSRLLREFARSVAGRCPVFWARPEAIAEAAPFSLLTDLLENIQDEQGAHADIADLRVVLARGDAAPRSLAASVRGLIGRSGSALLIVEDLHLADEMSQAVLAHLARAARSDSILVAASYRTEEAGRLGRLLELFARDRLAEEISLTPLDRHEVQAMLGHLAPGLDEEEREQICRLGEGVPFFIEELAASRAESLEAAVPASIARSVEARLASLEEQARSVLHAASLMTGAIDPGVLALAVDVPETQVAQAVLAGMRAGLLADEGGRLSFRHALVRDAVQSQIPSVSLSAIHLKLADAHERFYAQERDQHAASIAYHYLKARQEQHAAAYLLVAGARSLAVGALDEALRSYEDVLTLSVEEVLKAEARLQLAEVLVRRREVADAIENLHLAREVFTREGHAARARAALIRLANLLLPHDGDQALDLLDQAEKLLVGSADAHDEARIASARGYCLVRTFERVDEAGPWLEKAIGLARSLGDAELEAEALEGLAWMREFEGDIDRAEEAGRAACHLAQTTGNAQLVLKVVGNQAVRLALRGKGSEAIETLESLRVSSKGAVYLPSIDQVEAWVNWKLGRPNECYRNAVRAEANHPQVTFARQLKVWASIERDELEVARHTVTAWWSELGSGVEDFVANRVSDAGHPALFASRAQLQVLLAGDDYSDVLELAQAQFEPFSQASDEGFLVAGILLLRARLLVGDRGPATRELLERVSERAEGAAAPYWRGFVAELVAEMCHYEDPERGKRLMADAANFFADSDNTSDRLRVLRRLGELQVSTDAALSPDLVGELRTALPDARRVGAVRQARLIESLLRSCGIRPRAGRPKGSRNRAGTLTVREEEVVTLVAAGATNAEIAARLFLSERTVEDHISSANRRLGVSGRTGLAAWAVRAGLI